MHGGKPDSHRKKEFICTSSYWSEKKKMNVWYIKRPRAEHWKKEKKSLPRN